MDRIRKVIRFGAASPQGDFQRLLSEEQKENEEQDTGEALTTHNRTPKRPWIQWILATLLFCVYSVLLATFASRQTSDFQCAKQLSLWSPLNQAIEYQEGSLDNGFAHESEYRGPPTPELEETWDRLWHVGVAAFPEDKLPSISTPRTLADGRSLQTLPGEENKTSIAAQFVVFHDLHCLNLVRQYTWRDWYLRHPEIVRTPIDILDSEVGARMHADHCIEALRLSLMCHGDTTPLFTRLDPEAPLGAEADFSPHRKCRNFDRLHSWAEENRAFETSFKFDPEPVEESKGDSGGDSMEA